MLIDEADSDKENRMPARAPTPEAVDPVSIVYERNWDGKLYARSLKHCSSRQMINKIYSDHQEYLRQLQGDDLVDPAPSTPPSRAPTPGSSGVSWGDEPLDWGTDADEEYALSLHTAHHADYRTVLDQQLRKFAGWSSKNMSIEITCTI